MHVRAIHHNKRLLRPKRRPPRPQQPIFSVFHRGGLHFERHTASSRGFTATKRECCIIRTPTRRQTSPHSVKSHRHRCGEHGQIGRAWLRCRWAAAGPGWDTHSNDEPHWCGGYRRNWRACCGARGRRRGLAGLRDDAPSRRLAARTASGRAAAHGHAQQPGPTGTHSSPEHPWGTHSSPAPRARTAARNTRGAREKQQGSEAPQRLGPHTHVRQLLTG